MRKIILFILLTAGVAVAQPGLMGRHKPPGQTDRQGKIFNRLDLNPDQQTKVKTLRSQLRKDQIGLRAKIQTSRVELRDLFDKEKPDRAGIESKLSEISKLQNEMKLKTTGFWFDVNSLLTPEQQKTWKRVPAIALGEERPTHPGLWQHLKRLWGRRNWSDQGDGPDSLQSGDNE